MSQRVVPPRVYRRSHRKQLASRHAGAAGGIFAFGSLVLWRRSLLSFFLPDGVAQYRRRLLSRPLCPLAANAAGWNRLNDVLIDRYRWRKRGLPTLCKGRYLVDGERYHARRIASLVRWNCCRRGLMAANIASVKIEGRQQPAYNRPVARWRRGDRSLQKPPAKLRSTAQLDGDARRDVETANHAWRISP